MPRKATGGKVGRPTKAEKPFFTPRQLLLIEAVVENPKYKRKYLASLVGVSRSAVSQALRNKVVKSEIIRRITNCASQKLSAISERKDVIRNKSKTSFRGMMGIPKNKKEALFYQYAQKNFEKRFQLPGSDIWINTRHDYVRYLIKNDLWPAEIIEKMRKEASSGSND